MSYVPESHEHQYKAVVTPPSCTEDGYTTYTCYCGDSYVADETAALGHDWVSDVIAPTCTELGYTQSICSVCEYMIRSEYIDALGHSYEVSEIVIPTCTEGGHTQYTCSACGDNYIDNYSDPTGHNFEDGICVGCGMLESEMARGSCGENLTWVLTEDGMLMIFGEGDMLLTGTDVHGYPAMTWYPYRDQIQSVVINDGVTSVCAYAFSDYFGEPWPNLLKVNIGNSVKTIDDYAFYNCSNLSSVVFPNGLTSIGRYAFSNSRLRNITIPDSVTSIGDEAFANCAYLIRATIGNGVTAIGDRTFYNCPNLSNVRIGDSVASICESAFSGCTKLINVEIPSGVTSIDEMAFCNCDSLKSISLPGVVTIGREAFYSCDALASAEFGSALSTIGIFAFDSCSNLSEITFHGDAPDIGYEAFYGATANANYPEGNDTWTSDVMQDYGGELTWIPYSTNAEIASGWSGNTQWILTSDGVLTVYGSGNMKNYGYGGNQPWISYADQITSIVIEDGVTAVGDGAFMGLTKLESVTLPDTGLTKIGEAAFYGCSSLMEIDIPDSVYTVFDYTFKNCTSLESVRLSKILIKVGQGAFENCTSLANIFIPTNANIIGSWSFKGCTGLVEADMQWADATEIREGAFKNCSSLTNIILPADIQTLGDSCFYGIAATDFTVPETVTEVGPWCFARAYSLSVIRFEGNAPTIGEGAFNKLILTAYYPSGDAAWTPNIMQNYGGTITWKEN